MRLREAIAFGNYVRAQVGYAGDSSSESFANAHAESVTVRSLSDVGTKIHVIFLAQ
jgi:hypothetical protein